DIEKERQQMAQHYAARDAEVRERQLSFERLIQERENKFTLERQDHQRDFEQKMREVREKEEELRDREEKITAQYKANKALLNTTLDQERQKMLGDVEHERELFHTHVKSET